MTNNDEYYIKMFPEAPGDDDNQPEHKTRKGHRVEEALKYAHEIRQFEIGLYWRRAAYFWGFQVAVFAGYGVFMSKEKPLGIFLPCLLALLGFFISYAWYFLHRGSKAWQENWELHIDMLEEKITGNLYKTVLGKKHTFYSVSRINQSIIVSTGIFWLLALTYSFTKSRIIHQLFTEKIVICLQFLFALTAYTVIIVLLTTCTKLKKFNSTSWETDFPKKTKTRMRAKDAPEIRPLILKDNGEA